MNGPTWKGKCLAILGGMNSQRSLDEQLEVYDLVLNAIGEEYALRAVQWAVLNEEWRPSPAKLRQIAARVASPYPSADDAYAEIMDKASRIGLYGKPHPERPSILLEGPPPMSHPLVSRIVPHLGGWRMLCEGDAQMQEGLKKQVSSSHATVSIQWEQEVAQQLVLPPAQRNPLYFQGYKPYRAVAPITEQDYLALPPPPKQPEVDESIPLPEPVRKLISDIRDLHAANEREDGPLGSRWAMPAEESRAQSLFKGMLSRADRERHLAEVRAAIEKSNRRMEDAG